MTKPILVIKCKSIFTQEVFSVSRKSVMEQLNNEYHVIMISDYSTNKSFEFEVLSVDNADELTIEKLNDIEQLIKSNLN